MENYFIYIKQFFTLIWGIFTSITFPVINIPIGYLIIGLFLFYQLVIRISDMAKGDDNVK